MRADLKILELKRTQPRHTQLHGNREVVSYTSVPAMGRLDRCNRRFEHLFCYSEIGEDGLHAVSESTCSSEIDCGFCLQVALNS